MKSIIVNTSSKLCSVTFFEKQENKEDCKTLFFENHEKPSECLLNKVELLLKQKKLELSDIDVFGCVIGPGSFTGTRIGMSTVFGFCFGLDKPFIKINLFDLYKKNILFAGHAGGAYAFMDKKYCFIDKNKLEEVKQNSSENYVVLDIESDYFKNKFSTINFVNYATKHVYQNFINKNFDNIYSTEPIYIEKSQAEVSLEKSLKTFKIRKAKLNDLDSLVKLENVCFSSNVFSKEMLVSELSKSFNSFLVGELDGEIICFAIFSKPLDGAELIQICVLDKFRKMGFAEKLFNEFIKQNKPKKVFLEVNKNNTSAINLYSKLGFSQIGVRKNYYDNGDDCLVYIKTFREN